MASILIIDDNASIREFVRRILEADGHQIRDAANSHIGLVLYREAPADLVITDLLMPERDGMEVILALTKEFVAARIIAMTGATGEGCLLDVAALLGAHQVVRKPFTPEEMRRVVRRTLEGSS
ncbi:MAG: response regulator [Nitrospira sp.]|nr:response regulator [Nitrospira sp.]